jgi:iron only hydrogenase large subunit-like protein
VAQVIEGFSRIDQELCTGCGTCAQTCPAEAISGERHGPHRISEERCVGCGRCVQVCSAYDTVFQQHSAPRAERIEERGLPSGIAEPLFAAYDRPFIREVRAALADPHRVVVAQCGPAVTGALAEDFGLPAGSVPPGRIVAALRKIGFRKVYSFTLAAALAVAEEAHELVERLRSGRILPVINSSCPAAVKFIEQFHPELIHYLASCKSPHQIAGALLKSYVAETMKLGPAQMFSVSLGPCTSRKFEAARPEMRSDGYPQVDAVLTTRELAWLIKDSGIDLANMAEEAFDPELPAVAGMENVYLTPGDIAETVLRAGHYLVRRHPGDSLQVEFAATGAEGVRAAAVQLDAFRVKAVAVAGLPGAIPFFDAMKAGKCDVAFLEVLACPMGCVSGGGQPKVLLPQDRAGAYARRATRTQGPDAGAITAAVERIYGDWFSKPCGDKSNRVLHTQYTERRLGQ